MSLETGRWTESEHQRFLQGHNLYGRKWTKVAEAVGSLTLQVMNATRVEQHF